MRFAIDFTKSPRTALMVLCRDWVTALPYYLLQRANSVHCMSA